MKTILILSLFSTLLFCNEPKTLDVGIYENSPKIFTDSKGKPSGFFIDILNEIAHRENWQLNYVKCEWKECLKMLEEGRLDIMPDVAYSKERAKHFKFNKEVVLSNWSILFTKKDSKISSILDLDNKKIALLKDSIQHEQIQETFELFGIKPIFIQTKSFEESFSLTQSAQTEAAIVNRHYGELNKDKFKLIKQSSILMNPATLKFAFAPLENNNNIIDKIDLHLSELKNDKESIYYLSTEKYLTIKEDFKIPYWVYMFFTITIIIILLLTLVVGFFNYMLRLKTKEVLEKSTQFKNLEKEKLQDYKKILYALISMIEQRDSYTAGHSQRVAKYSELIAREMGFSDEECKLLYKASTLHDIGKIATPDAILLKPEKLSLIEYELIKEHVIVGVRMLQDVPMFIEISQIIKYHHERYDGSGYPNGYKEDEIPPLSRIMIVADAFDAMTTNRIYKHKKSVADALIEIESLSGIQFHPEVVKSVLSALSNIDTSQEFNQNPLTALEEHRFVYFYKDAITDLYNIKYLETTLVNNQNDEKYKSIAVISLHKFDMYNKKHGWESGNKALREFGQLLCKLFEESLIFRVQANDFIILQKDNFAPAKQRDKIEEFTKTKEIEFDFNMYDLMINKINSYDDLKRFL